MGKIDIIEEAQAKERALIFKYTNKYGETSLVMVNPVKVEIKKGEYYLYAWLLRIDKRGFWEKRSYRERETRWPAPLQYLLNRMTDLEIKNPWLPWIYYVLTR